MISLVRGSRRAKLQSHLIEQQIALCGPRHRRVHQPCLQHVAKVQACLQATGPHSAQATPTYVDEFMWRQRYKYDLFRHIVENIVEKYTPN